MIRSKWYCKVSSIGNHSIHSAIASIFQSFFQPLDLKIVVVCPKNLPGKTSSHRTSKLICYVNQLAGFYVIWISAGFYMISYLSFRPFGQCSSQFYPFFSMSKKTLRNSLTGLYFFFVFLIFVWRCLWCLMNPFQAT